MLTGPNCIPYDLIMIMTRGGILIIASLAGVFCIYLGWRLYRDTVVSHTNGEINAAGFKLTLTASSPGVFLAGFGIWLLMSVVNKPVTLEEAVPSKLSFSTEQDESNRIVQTLSNHIMYDANNIHFIADSPGAIGPTTVTTSTTPCVLRYKKAVFFSGQGDLEAEKISQSLKVALDAVKRNEGNTSLSRTERAQAIRTLTQLLNDTEP